LRLPVPPRPLCLRDQVLSAFSGEVELGGYHAEKQPFLEAAGGPR
jgi:hypothetical protein